MTAINTQLLDNKHTIDKKMSLYNFRCSVTGSLLPQNSSRYSTTQPKCVLPQVCLRWVLHTNLATDGEEISCEVKSTMKICLTCLIIFHSHFLHSLCLLDATSSQECTHRPMFLTHCWDPFSRLLARAGLKCRLYIYWWSCMSEGATSVTPLASGHSLGSNWTIF